MREQGGREGAWAHRKSPAMALHSDGHGCSGERRGRETSDLDQEAVRGGRVAGSMERRGGGLLEPS